jgi:hypothetical protein
MRRVRVAVTLLVLSILALSCTSEEERARALHSQSLEARKSGDPAREEELLLRIATDYPSTAAGAEAKKELEDIRFNKEVLVSNVVGNMRLAIAGQVLFLTDHGRYARDLEELCADKRGGFDRDFLNPQKGYRYEMTPEKGGYVLTASPAIPTLKKHFLADHTGYIHEETGKPATLESPITEY